MKPHFIDMKTEKDGNNSNQQSDNDDLAVDMLPCPFCGDEAEVVPCMGNDSYLDRKKARSYYDYQQRKRLASWFPRCKNVDCIAHQVEDGEIGGVPADRKSEKGAIELWNKRAYRRND